MPTRRRTKVMLALSSACWLEFSNGSLIVQLLRKIASGERDAYDELLHQACHQFSVEPVACAVVPHLIEFAARAAPTERFQPLLIIGHVVAGLNSFPDSAEMLPDNLRKDFEIALSRAIPLTTDALNHRNWDAYDTHQLIGVLAALHGRTDLATLLFLSSADLSCPACAEEIQFRDQ